MKEKFYLTTAITYTSGKPHIGNTYEAIFSDAIARFKRMQGFDVFFMTGTDEHGLKVEQKAAEKGVTPRQFVDSVAGEIKRIWDLMDVSYDKFIRTTDDYHVSAVQKIFNKLYSQGDIYKGAYEGLYCTPCESFWTESQLVDGKCPDCGRDVKPAKEDAYFFKMGKYANRLVHHILTHPQFIKPASRRNEMFNNFLLADEFIGKSDEELLKAVEGGTLKTKLQDLCVSRSTFKWGVPVEFDNKHVVYVWLDALTNYITGVGYTCLLYTSDAADDRISVDLGGRRIIKKIFFKQKTAYEIRLSLVGSEMCIRDSGVAEKAVHDKRERQPDQHIPSQTSNLSLIHI